VQLAEPEINITVSRDGSNAIVRICGEVDFATAPRLESVLKAEIENGMEHIKLDFQNVTFIDSEGLKVLMGISRCLRDKNGLLELYGCSEFLIRILDILGLTTHFNTKQVG